jgi:uncharacterized membrane protein YfcA
MLFLIEVCLTIAAWRKGWGAKALIPFGVGMVVAMLLGAAVGLSGGQRAVAQAFPMFLILDLALIAVLAWLATRAPQEVPLSVVPEVTPSEEQASDSDAANEIKVA